MPQPLCVKCQVEYRPKMNDVIVEEMASFGSAKLWCADLWECPVCHHQMITGYGQNPYGEHWQHNYQVKLVNANKDSKVYRCYELNAMNKSEAERVAGELHVERIV